MKSSGESLATFVNCASSNNHLISFETNIDCLYVRAFLKENGVKSVQFVSDNLPNIYDLADDILSLAGDVVIFSVNELNFYLSRIITHELKKIDSNKTIVYFGSMLKENFEYILNNTQVDLCVLSNPENSIYKLLKNGCDDYQNLRGIACKVGKEILVNTDISSSGYIPSPYLQRLVSADYAQKYGIIISRNSGAGDEYSITPEYLKENLTFIYNAYHERNICLGFVCDDISEYPYFGDLQRILSNFPFTYKSKIKVQHVNYEMIQTLVHLNFIKIDVMIDDDKFISDDTHWIDVLHRFIGDNVKFSFVFNFSISEINKPDLIKTMKIFIQNELSCPEDYIIRGAGICSPKIYPERNIIFNDHELLSMLYSEPYPSAFVNGYIAFMTGIYPSAELNNSVKHVVLSNTKISLEGMDTLKEFVSVNSAIIAPIPDDRSLHTEDIHFYTEGDRTKRSINEIFDENIAYAYHNNFYFPHLYLLKGSVSQPTQLIFDDLNTHSPLKLSYMPYSKADSALSEDINLLSIETSDDLQKFLYDVDCFISSGTFGNLYEIHYKIKDACRWLSSSSCLVGMLPRLTIDNSGSISSCGGCNKSIGSIHDSYFKVYRQVHVLSEEAQVDRNCTECEVNNECSRCCFLPNFLHAGQFCEMMKMRPYVNLYMGTKSTLNLLMEKSIFKSVKLSDIKVSNKYVSQLIPNQPIETSRTSSGYLYPHIYLFHANEKHYVVNTVTGKVFGASESMAVIMEFLQKCFDVQQAKAFFSEKYSLNEDNTNKEFNKIISSFIQSGFMSRMVF